MSRRDCCRVLMSFIVATAVQQGLAAGPVDPQGRPLIRKLGTIDCDVVETTPVVFAGKVYRFEWDRKNECFHFVDRQTGKTLPPFAKGYRFGSAYVEDDTVYVTGTKTEHGWYGHTVTMFVSKDLRHRMTFQVQSLDTARFDERFDRLFEEAGGEIEEEI